MTGTQMTTDLTNARLIDPDAGTDPLHPLMPLDDCITPLHTIAHD
jgi:hypothetical protein